jgi:hypothetical protein
MRQQAPSQYFSLGNLSNLSACGLPAQGDSKMNESTQKTHMFSIIQLILTIEIRGAIVVAPIWLLVQNILTFFLFPFFFSQF